MTLVKVILKRVDASFDILWLDYESRIAAYKCEMVDEGGGRPES